KELIEQKWGHIKNKVKKTRDNFPKFVDCFRLCIGCQWILGLV
ncbi:MAG: hypothetical protein ACI9CD_000378, partial [Candidatus Deianiraeaceae bacterium]